MRSEGLTATSHFARVVTASMTGSAPVAIASVIAAELVSRSATTALSCFCTDDARIGTRQFLNLGLSKIILRT